MSAENKSDTQDTGLAPSPLETRGGDDFSAILSGQEPSTKTTTKTETAEQDPSKPPATISKPVDMTKSDGGTTQTHKLPPQGTQTTGIDPKVLEEIVAASTRGVRKATATQTEQVKADKKELSPEEFNAKYGIQPVTPAHIAALLDQDPTKAAAALNNLLISTVRSAVLMSKDVFEAQLGRTRSEYEPHVRSWQAFQAKQREDAAQSAFYTKYPDLKDEKELVQEMIDSIKAKKDAGAVSFSSDEQVFEAVAAASRKLLARMNTQASSASGKHTQTQNNGQPSRQMAQVSTSGRSGTGQTATRSDVDEVFGTDAR